ncbi:MAG: tyrosine--tRNA ligase [Crocinitomicaceae bacterium]|nr:tyrosine--tRNA ligase [Crocinitomicaceae bacterium]
MPQNFVEELRWRGMLQDIIPGTEELLNKEMVTGYVGFDPTADSLHVGSLIPILLLMHLQRAGHKPVALVGGATGMVGDPSGKSAERNLLDEATLDKNVAGVRAQLEHFLDFNAGANSAVLVNNYDWMKNFSFIEFIRDVGKHITVNYMSAKDSVKKRIETGISFTEFSYQLLQGYDFLHLYRDMNCKLQMGGSDQWGNITTGTELIRRIGGGEGYAFTCPLMTKADGGKFGKTESGTIWLDPNRTSPYQFYQFWFNASDDDAGKYIRTFTFLDRATIEGLEKEHAEAPHLRILQKRLAEEVTVMVHGKEALESALRTTEILFNKSATVEDLRQLSVQDIMDGFDGVPQATVNMADIESGLGIVDALSAKTGFLPSNSEARRELKGNAISVNKAKVQEDYVITKNDLISDKVVLLGKGKKNNYIIIVE